MGILEYRRGSLPAADARAHHRAVNGRESVNPMANRPKASSPAREAKSEEGFARVTRAFADDPEVSFGRLFASDGLKVHNKIFAMLVRGSLVVKLPKARVDALVGARNGERFDPGHGRLMKEWVVIAPGAGEWLALAQEARRFVGG